MNNQAVESVMQYSKMSGTKRLILMAIAKHINYKTYVAFPSNQTIANLSGCSSKQVKRLLPEIVKSGELEIIGGYGTGKKREFRILLPMETAESYNNEMSENTQNSDEKRTSNHIKMSEIEALIDTKMSAFMSEIENKIRTLVNQKADISENISDILEKKADIPVNIEVYKKEDKKEEQSLSSSKGMESTSQTLHELPVEKIQNAEIPDELNTPEFISVWNDFVNHRIEMSENNKKKRPMTNTAKKRRLASLAKECKKHGIDRVIFELDVAIEKQWDKPYFTNDTYYKMSKQNQVKSWTAKSVGDWHN